MFRCSVVLFAYLVGCADQPHPPMVLGDRGIVPGDILQVTWSSTASHAPNDPAFPDAQIVSCTTTISHPCSFITYTRALVISDDGASMSWTDATGGVDLAGVPAENRLPWIDTLRMDDNSGLVLDERGDDGGLRHEAHLMPEPIELDGRGGYAGAVTWNLYTVAGYTTFTVHVAF